MPQPNFRSRIAQGTVLGLAGLAALAMVSAGPPAQGPPPPPKLARRAAMPFVDGKPFMISISGAPAGVQGLKATYTHTWSPGVTTTTTWPLLSFTQGTTSKNLTAVFAARLPAAPASTPSIRRHDTVAGTGILAISTTAPAADLDPPISIEQTTDIDPCPCP